MPPTSSIETTSTLPSKLAKEIKQLRSDQFNDQIAFFSDQTDTPAASSGLTLSPLSSGSFDFTGLVHKDLSNQQISFRLSDHLPLWVEFGV